MNSITGVLLFKDGYFFRKPTSIAVNTAQLTGGIKPVFLLPPKQESGQDEYILSDSNPKNLPNALQGVQVIEAGVVIVLDVATVKEVTDAINATDPADAVLTPKYNGTFPAAQAPVQHTYSVARTDRGTEMAANNFQVDYMRYIIDGSFVKTGVNNGVTTYGFKSTRVPVPVGTDTVTQTA